MLHYLVTEDRLRVIVTTPTLQIGRDTPIQRRDLNTLIFQFRELLADPRRDPKALSGALYDLLIAPVLGDLTEAAAETLLVSLDGPLRHLPLAALWDGRSWLVERYRVVHFARAALDKLMRERGTHETLAALGCGRPVPGFQELTAVPAELEGIVKRDETDPDGELPGVVKLDDAFSREALTTLLEARRFTTVHIASHFVLRPEGEAESYLLLGDGSRLTLEDMRYDLRFDGVGLLSLSACNTAIGEDRGDGRELEGFASLAMRLGARAVLATLWPVNDASTGLFMRTLFHRVRQDPKRSRADVLRSAMLAFIRGEVAMTDESLVAARGPRPLPAGTLGAAPPASPGASPEAPTIDLTHPRYWAPFVLIGNWR
jgi:CHAT domain-containing protein